jgi:sarcosine oxidase subunit gamma
VADDARHPDYLRQSALAHLGLVARAQPERGDAGVAMGERPPLTIVDLRIRDAEAAALAAVEGVLGYALPLEANRVAGTDGAVALWLGPDEWWVITAVEDPALADRLSEALADHPAAVTDLSESRACIRVSGPRARDLLAKGCSLDLHPRVFSPGHCAQSHLAKAQVVLHQVSEEPAFDLYVLRSFADYLWAWLEDAAGEYGLAVV